MLPSAAEPVRSRRSGPPPSAAVFVEASSSSLQAKLLRAFLPDRNRIAKYGFQVIGLSRDNWPPVFAHGETAHPSGTHACPLGGPYRGPVLRDNRNPPPALPRG